MLTLLVVFGSITPFRFDAGALTTIGLSCLRRISWLPVTIEDLEVNLLVYLPVGFTFYGWVRRFVPFTAHGLRPVGIATALGGVLSLSVEALQTLSPVRCASWVDVMINTYGALLGAACAPHVARGIRLAIARLRGMFADNPLSFIALLMTIGLIVHGTAPFDFVLSTDGFRESLFRSQWWPIAEHHTPQSIDYLLNPYEPLFSTIGGAGAFVLLGAVQALANRRRGLAGAASLMGAVGHAAVLAVLIETLQLFVQSRTFETTDLIAGTVGATLGAWFVVALIDRTAGGTGGQAAGEHWQILEARVKDPWRPSSRDNPAATTPAFLIGAVILCQIVYAVAWAVSPFDSFGSSFDASYVCWMPFAGYFHMSFLQAVGHITSPLLVCLLLAASLALYQWRRSGRIRWGQVAVIVTGVVLACESAQFWAPTRVSDATAPVIGLIAVLACRAIHRGICAPGSAIVASHS